MDTAMIGAARRLTAIALSGSAVTRFVFLRWVSPRAFQKCVLVLGAGRRAASVEALVRRKNSAVKIVGYLPVNSSQNYIDADRILPFQESLLECVRRHQVTEIVVALSDRRGGSLPVQELLACRLRGILITDSASFFERERCQLHLDSLNMSWIIFGEGFRQGVIYSALKRLVDVVASAVLLVATLPVTIITALCIYLEDGRPIFYRQERVGQGGRIFTILKFRSMRVNAECDGLPRWARADDVRTTAVGRKSATPMALRSTMPWKNSNMISIT